MGQDVSADTNYLVNPTSYVHIPISSINLVTCTAVPVSLLVLTCIWNSVNVIPGIFDSQSSFIHQKKNVNVKMSEGVDMQAIHNRPYNIFACSP